MTPPPSRPGVMRLVRPASYSGDKPDEDTNTTPSTINPLATLPAELPFDAIETRVASPEINDLERKAQGNPESRHSLPPESVATETTEEANQHHSAPVPKRPRDPEMAEMLYRAGHLTVRQIGERSGMSHTMVIKLATKYGWVRDICEKIVQKTEDKVSRLTALEVSDEPKPGTKMSEATLIESVADVIAQVRMKQRARFAKAGALADALTEQLQECVRLQPDLLTLGHLMANPDENGHDALNDTYMKIIQFPALTKQLKDLADVLKNLVTLETESYKLGSTPEGGKGGRLNLPIRFVQARIVTEDDDGA